MNKGEGTLPPIIKIAEQKLGYHTGNLRILDFGCGAGNKVKQLCDLGYEAYGVDIAFKEGPHLAFLLAKGRLKKIEDSEGCVPFLDNFFDVVFSEQVLEHVQDHNLVAKEISRVMKPGGVSIHRFPSRLRPFESHVGVLFASVIRWRAWLFLWILLGIRFPKKAKHGNPIVETDRASKYLKNKTKYLNGNEIKAIFGTYFENVKYAEKCWLMNSPNIRGRMLHRVSLIFPFIFWIYRTFWTRVLILQK